MQHQTFGENFSHIYNEEPKNCQDYTTWGQDDLAELYYDTAEPAKSDDFALAGSTGGNLAGSGEREEPNRFICKGNLSEITTEMQNLPELRETCQN